LIVLLIFCCDLFSTVANFPAQLEQFIFVLTAHVYRFGNCIVCIFNSMVQEL